jgi:hypothetical protein
VLEEIVDNSIGAWIFAGERFGLGEFRIFIKLEPGDDVRSEIARGQI